MASAIRQVSWRQGNVLSGEAAKRMDLQHPEGADKTIVVLVSHDCDLAACQKKEPRCEIIVGRRIDKLGAESYGKIARRLHVEYQAKNGPPIAVELMATNKRPVDKGVLFGFEPSREWSLDQRGIGILQRWLAARYYRASFPEAFEDRLRSAAGLRRQTFLGRIETILTAAGEHVRAILFDLDEGQNVERIGPEDLYRLGINVLYISEPDELTARRAAQKAAESLEELFEAAFRFDGDTWQNIQLLYCDALSDAAITVAQNERLRQWRLEHMSLRDDPPQPMLSF